MDYDDRYGDNSLRRHVSGRHEFRDSGDNSIFGSSRSRNDWRRDDDWRTRPRSTYGLRDRFDDARRRDRDYGPDDYRDDLPRDETGHLIASNKVEGTAVYGRDGERLGTIYNFMVDKISGHVEYAVMAYGGFLRMGERYYPLPWRVLTYDTMKGGYRVNMTEDDLRDAPSFDRDNEPNFDRRYGNHIYDFYGLYY